MAVIHLWHSLPYRNYPISKNVKIGEQIWTTAVQELVNSKSLSESAAISLMDSLRDSLAAEAISPESFDKVKRAILGDTSEKPSWPEHTSEDSLTPETRNFLVNIIPEFMQRRMVSGQIQIERSQHEEKMEKLVDSFKYGVKITAAHLELIDRIFDAFEKKDFREVIGWLGWLYLLILFEDMVETSPEVKANFTAMATKVIG